MTGGAGPDAQMSAQPARRAWLQPYLPAMVVLLLAWSWYVHFWPNFQTANESIRLYFVEAVVETGRPELDSVTQRRHDIPFDRSEFGGHIYMDKAPGLSVLALPLYPIVRAVVPEVAGKDLWIFGVVVNFLTVTVPAWLLLWLLLRYLQATGGTPRTAMITALALGLASPFFSYATLYFGHALAAACVGAAFYLLASSDAGLGTLRTRLWAGALLGYAGLVDTPVFVLSAAVVTWAFVRAEPLSAGLALPRRLRACVPLLAMVAAGVAAQLLYNAWMLGHPLRFAYHYKGDLGLAKIHNGGFFGFNPPDLNALVQLTVGPARGLLYHSPWLLAAWLGLAGTALAPHLPVTRRLDAAALLSITGLYILVIAGFSDWKAGDSAYARHLVPILPLSAPGLAHVLGAPRMPRFLRAIVLASLGVGLLLTLPTVATFPYYFDKLDRPVLELGWPLWLTGHYSPSVGRWLGWSDWTSAFWFLVLCLAPWLLALRLHATQPEGQAESGRDRATVWIMAVLGLLLWVGVLVAAVPEPGRRVQHARFQASTLLGPDADERDGNKYWQLLLKRANDRQTVEHPRPVVGRPP